MNGSSIDHYDPIISSAHDYYPFGMLMPGRGGSLDTSGTWVVPCGGRITKYRLVPSQDRFHEDEVLVIGVVTGAEVLHK